MKRLSVIVHTYATVSIRHPASTPSNLILMSGQYLTALLTTELPSVKFSPTSQPLPACPLS